MATTLDAPHMILLILFVFIACFYLFRLVHQETWLHSLDAENEIGHGIMAVGMIIMLAPAGIVTAGLILWNIILFAFATLWFIVRLFTQKPLLAIVLRVDGMRSTRRSDAIHALMHAGMCYMFLLLSSMSFSMTLPATCLSSFFLVIFAFLTYFYGREVFKDVQAAKKDRLKLGANLAHLLMSSVMGWMFLEMMTMAMTMRLP